MQAGKEKGAQAGPFVLFAKMSAKLLPALIKLAKLVKLGKLSLAAVSVGSYALIFTWQFALVITGMLVVHEYGHLLLMKHHKMRTKGMYLIPFIGAAAVADEDFPTRKAEAEIAIAGPLVGAALAVISGLLYAVTNNPYLAAVASWMALINLFNLIPVSPLDGGRVLKSITFSISTKLGLGFMIVVMSAAVVLAIREELLIFAILIPIGILEFVAERRSARNVFRPQKPLMSKQAVRYAFSGYVSLAVFLWIFMLVMANEPGAQAAMHILQG
jgi:Zn-dependent protease